MIDRETMTRLRKDIDEALKAVAKKHNLSIKLGNGSYDATGLSGSFKLEITAAGTSLALENLKRHYPAYVGKVLETPQGKYTLVGLKPRGISFLAERVPDKKLFRFPLQSVSFYLSKTKSLPINDYQRLVKEFTLIV